MPYIKHAYVLVFDGFADHEVALALSEIHRHERYQVITCGFDRRPVTAMSGLRVMPDIACEDIALERAGLFILPGGALWEHVDRERHDDTVTATVTDMLQSVDAAGAPVAAIGGATFAVARAGLLDGVNHTSNGPEYLSSMAGQYGDAAFYINAPAVRDQNIITANGSASVEFAHEIIGQLASYDDGDQPLWFALCRHNGARQPITGRRAA